jgi:hypothetical protein
MKKNMGVLRRSTRRARDKVWAMVALKGYSKADKQVVFN